jgi:lipopolysaccharide export LptBFGC system permease protein LptF
LDKDKKKKMHKKIKNDSKTYETSNKNSSNHTNINSNKKANQHSNQLSNQHYNKHSTKHSKKLSRYQRWRKRAVKKIEERLQEESKKMIILKFFAAPILVLSGVVVLFIILEYEVFIRVGSLMIAYFFPPLGKEAVIPIGVAAGVHPIVIALSIGFVDIFVALFLVWNYDFAKLIPFLGPWMEKVEKKGGKAFTERPWLENIAFIGLILFVMFPFQGSGGLATSIIGRIIGMNKIKVFIAICIGAIVGCLLIAYFADMFIGFFKNNLYQGLAILIAIAVILAVYNVFKHLKK